MEKTETRKRRGSVGKGYYDFKEDSLGRPMKKEVGERASHPTRGIPGREKSN